MTKLILRFKGGKGSGNFGHKGRKGLVGGSSSNAYSAVSSLYEAATSNSQIRNVLVGLMADGEHGGAASIYEAISYAISGGEDLSEDIASIAESDKRLAKIEQELDREYSDVVNSSGYNAPPTTRSADPESAITGALSQIENKYGADFDRLYQSGKLDEEFKKLIEEFSKPRKLSDERKLWEKKYYGKVVGGFQKGQDYAFEQIRKFLQSAS